jgi:putative membrane protein
MDRQQPLPEHLSDPRTYPAAERTLLAWIRTGLAMMGFGFVVARFGLFLREIAAVRDVPAPPRLGSTMWVGTTLVIFGVAVNVCAAVKHWRIVRRLAQGRTIPMRPLSLASVVAVVLAIFGLLIAAYLLVGVADANG